MILRLFQWIGLVLVLAACRANGSEPQGLIPRSTLPPGVEADALYVDQEAERQGIELMAANPGGLGLGFHGTYGEIVPSFYTTFRVHKGSPFIGEFRLRSGKLEEHSYVLLCLFDYVQIPCSPQADPFRFVQGVGQGDVVPVPLQVPIDDEGLHDLIVLYQEDPYLVGPVGSSLPDRTLQDLYEMRANVSVEGQVTSPTLSYVEPSGQPGQGSIPYGCVPTDELENAVDERGGWIIWTETSAQAGEFVDFFLHFDNPQDHNYAVVAFVDFQQVPIYFDEVPHLPLYVQTRASTWHTLPVRIRAPEQPGRYEFRLIALAEPYAWLDSLPDGKALTDFPKSSPRILLEVE